YQTAGKQDRALPLLERTLELQTARCGPDHPDTLSSMNNLAACYQATGKLDRALPLLEKALELSKAKLGHDHPDTRTIMNNLAMGYLDAGKLDRALPLLAQTLERQKAKRGPDHPSTLRTMDNLAGCYLATGKLDRALPLYETALELTKARLGPDHPDVRALEAQVTFVRRLLDSEERYRRQKAAKGAGHIDTLLALRDVAQMHLAIGQLDRAEQLLAEVLEGMAGRPVDDEIRLFTVALLAHSLALREKAQPRAWQTSNARSMLGGAL